MQEYFSSDMIFGRGPKTIRSIVRKVARSHYNMQKFDAASEIFVQVTSTVEVNPSPAVQAANVDLAEIVSPHS